MYEMPAQLPKSADVLAAMHFCAGNRTVGQYRKLHGLFVRCEGPQAIPGWIQSIGLSVKRHRQIMAHDKDGDLCTAVPWS